MMDDSYLFRLIKRGDVWAVVGRRANTIAYCSSSYAKAAGVHEYLTGEWRQGAPDDAANTPTQGEK